MGRKESYFCHSLDCILFLSKRFPVQLNSSVRPNSLVFTETNNTSESYIYNANVSSTHIEHLSSSDKFRRLIFLLFQRGTLHLRETQTNETEWKSTCKQVFQKFGVYFPLISLRKRLCSRTRARRIPIFFILFFD